METKTILCRTKSNNQMIIWVLLVLMQALKRKMKRKKIVKFNCHSNLLLVWGQTNQIQAVLQL